MHNDFDTASLALLQRWQIEWINGGIERIATSAVGARLAFVTPDP